MRQKLPKLTKTTIVGADFRLGVVMTVLLLVLYSPRILPKVLPPEWLRRQTAPTSRPPVAEEMAVLPKETASNALLAENPRTAAETLAAEAPAGEPPAPALPQANRTQVDTSKVALTDVFPEGYSAARMVSAPAPLVVPKTIIPPQVSPTKAEPRSLANTETNPGAKSANHVPMSPTNVTGADLEKTPARNQPVAPPAVAPPAVAPPAVAPPAVAPPAVAAAATSTTPREPAPLPKPPAVKEKISPATSELTLASAKTDPATQPIKARRGPIHPFFERYLQRKEYYVREGDTLNAIAHHLYQDEAMANTILGNNSAQLKKPEDLKPGMLLRLP